MTATFSFAAALDRLGLRSLVAFAANLAFRLRGRGGGQRFSVDDRGHWVNAQSQATIVSPTIHTAPVEDMRDTVLENWCWQYLPKAGDVVIDVGAGVGEEAVVFSTIVGPTGRVVSIEAHPETFECLRGTIERSSLNNVTALPFAVTDRSGEVRIHEQSNHLANSIISTGQDEGEAVVSTTLDAVALDLELGTVALLKMNIEGAERSAVRGMETLARKLRHVVISCHDFIADRGEGGDALRTFDDVQAVLESLGFETSCRADHVLPWVRYYILHVADRARATGAGDLCKCLGAERGVEPLAYPAIWGARRGDCLELCAGGMERRHVGLRQADRRYRRVGNRPTA